MKRMPLDGLAKRGSGFQRTVFLHRFWTVLFFVLCLQQLAEAQWWPFNTNFSIFTNQIEPGFRYPKIVSAARTQQRFPKSMHLPCDNVQMRSDTVPTSVHQLRPGDIDVVAALGDSLIAGNGAMEEFAMGTLFEHRGVSWCAGGDGTWHQFLTVPNIIKEFNPRLRGYSTGKGEFHSPNSRLNVAIPVSADENLLQQARILVARMRKDSQINIQKHWKLITILIGANDLCSSQCYKPEENTGEQHRRQIERALDYLQKHLPRTFVSLVSVVDVLSSKRVPSTYTCQFLHRLFCTCYHRGQKAEDMWKVVREYQKAEEMLTLSGKYDSKPDFTVVFQPFLKVLDAPWSEIKSGKFEMAVDASYITYDCFHFSQKGHAMMANMYWNNLLEPVGNKTQSHLPNSLMHPFKCPSPKAPFLFTKQNSENFYKFGRQ
ncbi:phospholipase B1, membrane-associated-like [Cloeon dipterum]|uniref:phospholipase B1, membrane-associated-like n=1 Tax=Cloeon dipterum TaxID=197152 RepID=UPI00321F93BA